MRVAMLLARGAWLPLATGLFACASKTSVQDTLGSTHESPPPSVTELDATSATAPDHRAEINRLIASLGKINTDKQADLEPVKKADRTAIDVAGANNGSYTCTQSDYQLTKVPEKFVALNPNADVLWPGSLVQGKSMAGGILDPIPSKRAPGTITLVLASGGAGPFSKKIDEPSLSAAIGAQNEILNAFKGTTPAKFSYSYTSIYSSKQLAVAIDANVSEAGWSLGGLFSVDKSDAKSRFLIQFSQEYFTMAFNPPEGPAGVFAPDVTAESLAPYVGNGNPPVYISSVTYGRLFYILFESNESQRDLEAAIRGSLGDVGSASVSLAHKKIVNESTVKAYGLGGNAEAAIGAVTGSDQFEKISKFLSTGANFDKSSPGAPISYAIRHLADSTQVRLALTTEYTAKNCTPVPYGCDGSRGSTKVVDTCGVCGGDGTSCASCKAETMQTWATNGAYVNFNIGAAPHNSNVVFPDGNYGKFANFKCNNLSWGNVLFTCSGGRWYFTRGSLYEGSACKSDVNEAWTDGFNSITTGYAKH